MGATLPELREVVNTGSTDGLAERGRAIRASQTATMDGSLIAGALGGIAESIGGLSGVYREGVPGRDVSLYSQLTPAGWELDSHLSEIGFYSATESNLPRFTPQHIEDVIKQLVHTESLAATLTEIGFGEQEQVDLVAAITAQSEELSVWYPTWFLAESEFDEVNPEYVPPLQRRAVAGSLDWISGLDKFLWQNEVLITDAILEAGMHDIRTALAGVHLMGVAAERLSEGTVSDEELTALVSGSSAIAIAGQTALVEDVVRINDHKRAPPVRRESITTELR